jgi:sugar phosphate isomerase/epimerase
MRAFISGRRGLQLISVQEALHRDCRATLRRVAQLGYQEVELVAVDTDSASKDPFYGLGANGFGDALNECGLKTRAAHWAAERDASVERVAEAAARFGLNTVVLAIPPGLVSSGGMHAWLQPSAYRSAAALINRWASVFASHGLRLAYHNHYWEFARLGETTGYDILLNETDPRLVSMELDICWALVGGVDPIALFKANPGRFPLAHIKAPDWQARAVIKTMGAVIPGLDAVPTDLAARAVDYAAIFDAATTFGGMQQCYIEGELSSDPWPAVAEAVSWFQAR